MLVITCHLFQGLRLDKLQALRLYWY